MATAGSLSLGLAARVLAGAGDAMTFISVLRLIPAWFPARRAPLVTQLSGLLGQAGQIVAAFPLVAGLHAAGWTPTFDLAAGLGLLAAVAVAVGLCNAPPGVTMAAATGRLDALRASWREPGTRLGLSTHFVTAFSGNVFALFWGYPYVVQAQGLSSAAASGARDRCPFGRAPATGGSGPWGGAVRFEAPNSQHLHLQAPTLDEECA